jgi:hypothetical protein
MANDAKAVRTALARAVATRQVPDEVIDLMTKQLTAAKLPIRGIDICTYGICIDFIIDDMEWWRKLPDVTVLDGATLKNLEVFPWGIPFPDIVHVRVAQSFDVMP